MHKQMRMFDGWWKDVIKEKEIKTYKKEVEGIRNSDININEFKKVKEEIPENGQPIQSFSY